MTKDFLERRTLPIPLTEEQIEAYRARNAEIDILQQEAAERLDRAKAAHKADTEPLKAEKKVKLAALRSGTEYREVECWENVNEEEGTLEYLDAEGVLIYSRKLTPTERIQYKIQFQRDSQFR
ncbi:hypothetical protein [Rudanella lutea]|uniref:hypothetical protein n=1 Tax=Rudanella lutea TaxID=451374 RepID=UPI000373EAE1|nr:hypothetical protein [Rudanella lutea]